MMTTVPECKPDKMKSASKRGGGGGGGQKSALKVLFETK